MEQYIKRYIIAKRRSEYGKIIRRQFKNDIGVPYQACKGYSLMLDGYSNTLTTFVSVDNQIFELFKKNKSNMTDLVYREHPTKEQLIEYFSPRIRIRKMTPKEALRLMDVTDGDIAKIQAANIAKTQQYKLAGNSIVVSCMYHIFRTLFISGQPENQQAPQPSLFDYVE